MSCLRNRQPHYWSLHYRERSKKRQDEESTKYIVEWVFRGRIWWVLSKRRNIFTQKYKYGWLILRNFQLYYYCLFCFLLILLLLSLLLFIKLIYVISYLFFFSIVNIRLYDRIEVKPCLNRNEFTYLLIYKLVYLKIVSIIRVILCRI
jgi:hypothetical protein